MLALFLLSGLVIFSKGNFINCTTSRQCQSQTYECTSGEACIIECSGDYSCQLATFTCADGYDCNVYCDESNACYSSTLICPSNANCDVACSRSSYSCKYLNVTAIESNTLSITDCNCDGCCDYMDVSCPSFGDYGDCIIEGSRQFDGVSIYLKGMDFDGLMLDIPSNDTYHVSDETIGKVYCDVNDGSYAYLYGDLSIGNEMCIGFNDNITNYIGCSYSSNDCNFGINTTCTEYAPCSIICGNNYACAYGTFNCMDNYDCYLQCLHGKSVCQNTVLQCPQNADCVINCNADNLYACQNAKINAMNSNSLMVLGCSGNKTIYSDYGIRACENMEIYCPMSGICYIEGGDNMINTEIWIHSNDLFDNIIFNYSGDITLDYSDIIGEIYCGYDNTKVSCDIESVDPLVCDGDCTTGADLAYGLTEINDAYIIKMIIVFAFFFFW